jgi:hypothetical protein
MATRTERLAEFTTDADPQPGLEVELLCEDHNGTYLLPFSCHRAEGAWLNKATGEEVQVRAVGWRVWKRLPRMRPQKEEP